MFKKSLLTIAALAVLATPAFAAECITSKGSFGAYKQGLAKDASKAGVGKRGLQALNAASLSDITWRFESRPSSQTGVSQGDPARFLAKRSGSSAQNFVNQTRKKIARNPNTFAAIERKYGVPASLLATIWGLETSWGGYLGKTPIVSGAVTLASYCRRHPKFEVHAIAALKMADRGVISGKTRGGPSGELGHMQFLAGNWLRYGVDGNGDGRADPYTPPLMHWPRRPICCAKTAGNRANPLARAPAISKCCRSGTTAATTNAPSPMPPGWWSNRGEFRPIETISKAALSPLIPYEIKPNCQISDLAAPEPPRFAAGKPTVGRAGALLPPLGSGAMAPLGQTCTHSLICPPIALCHSSTHAPLHTAIPPPICPPRVRPLPSAIR